MGQQFLGVYATNEQAPSLGGFPKPMGKRKRLWFVWEMPDGKYKIQALNAVHLPMAEPRSVSHQEFERRFTHEPECSAKPEGHTESGDAATAPRASLPDLFMTEQGQTSVSAHTMFFSSSGPLASEDSFCATDPNLLMNWIKAEPRSKRRNADPAKIPFDRLVDEVVETPNMPDSFSGASEAAPESPAESANAAEQTRLLRSKFVQALLMLRRGEKAESIALLQEMLAQPSASFDGGAQIFSEFGLGLRRLGLIQLGLAAHKRALEFAPEDPRVFFNIARSYHDLGHLAESKAYLEQALVVAPDFGAARQFLSFLDVSGPETQDKK